MMHSYRFYSNIKCNVSQHKYLWNCLIVYSIKSIHSIQFLYTIWPKFLYTIWPKTYFHPPTSLLHGTPSITEDNGCYIFRQVWLPSLCFSYQDNYFISHGLSLWCKSSASQSCVTGQLHSLVVFYSLYGSLKHQ